MGRRSLTTTLRLGLRRQCRYRPLRPVFSKPLSGSVPARRSRTCSPVSRTIPGIRTHDRTAIRPAIASLHTMGETSPGSRHRWKKMIEAYREYAIERAEFTVGGISL